MAVADDDMVILVVENKELLVGSDEEVEMPAAIVKEEPLDDSKAKQRDPAVVAQEILLAVEEHGEFFDIKEEEDDYVVEYLEEEFHVEVNVEKLENDNDKVVFDEEDEIDCKKTGNKGKRKRKKQANTKAKEKSKPTPSSKQQKKQANGRQRKQANTKTKEKNKPTPSNEKQRKQANTKAKEKNKLSSYEQQINEDNTNSKKIGKPIKSKVRCKSFVQQLQNLYPEMKEDPKLLIDHLANVMNDLKPPSPPIDFCTVIVEDDTTQFECTICYEKLDSLPASKRHYQFCHGPRCFLCFACGDDFRRPANLYKHEKRCTAPDARTVLQARGQFLGRKGRGRPFLTKHKFYRFGGNQPEKEKPKPKRLYCSQCPASFTHREKLEAHENSHAGVRPYQCRLCVAAYTSDAGLKRHLQVHSTDVFICDYCGRTFNMKPALKSHLNTHSELRKHPCAYCPRRFAQLAAARHHMNRVHLNLPAACGCPVCPKRYARMTHVRDHMKKAHGLAMITRKMFHKALPNITDIDVKEAKIVFKTESDQLSLMEDEYATEAANTYETITVTDEVEMETVTDEMETVTDVMETVTDEMETVTDEMETVTDEIETVKHEKGMVKEEIETGKVKTETVKVKTESVICVPEQSIYQISKQIVDSCQNEKEGKIFEVVLDTEENEDMMGKFLQLIQSKVEPGTIIRVCSGSNNVNNKSVEVQAIES